MSSLPLPAGPKRVAVYKDGKSVRIFEGADHDANMRDAELLKSELKAANPSADISVKVLSSIRG